MEERLSVISARRSFSFGARPDERLWCQIIAAFLREMVPARYHLSHRSMDLGSASSSSDWAGAVEDDWLGNRRALPAQSYASRNGPRILADL